MSTDSNRMAHNCNNTTSNNTFVSQSHEQFIPKRMKKANLFVKSLGVLALILASSLSVFGQTKKVLNNWMGGDASAMSFPYSADYVNPVISSSSMDYVNMTPVNDNRFVFNGFNSGSFNLSSSSYLS
ncbi:MAG: hypothetical protein ACK5AR_06250, partial [Flavobacteriia bacterium]